VQQGDPLGPLYFCCGLQSIIDRIAALNPTYQKWYMDDGGIVGSTELLLKVWVFSRRMVLVLASFSTLPSVSGRGSTQSVFCRVLWSKCLHEIQMLGASWIG
jgi:hypothetical protein